MKVIKHEDLKLLVQLVTDCPVWDIYNFKQLIDRFGSDHFFTEDGFVEIAVNEEMTQIRKNLTGRS